MVNGLTGVRVIFRVGEVSSHGLVFVTHLCLMEITAWDTKMNHRTVTGMNAQVSTG